MVVVGYRGDFNAAFWIDGFLPDRNKTERLFSARFPEQPVTIGKHNNPIYKRSTDMMVEALLEAAYDENQKKHDCSYSYLYLHHIQGVSPSLSILDGELLRQTHDSGLRDYRQIVTVCDLRDEKAVRKSTTDMAKNIDLEVRRAYQDPYSFKRSVQGLLEVVTEPFVSPKSAAVRQLRQFGLQSL